MLPKYLIALIVFTTLSVSAADGPAEAVVTYDLVRPVFRKHCVTCHNAERPRGDLDLSSIDAIKAGSGSGQVAVVSKSDESPIYTMAAHLEEPFMPPNSPKIPQRELDLIRRWIDSGLQDRKSPGEKPGELAANPATTSNTTAVVPLRRKTAVTALAVSPIAPLAALSGQRQVVLFSLTDHQPQRAIPFPEGDVFVAKFSRDGELLLIAGGIGGASGTVVGVEVATGRRVFELGDETDAVLAADISPDKRFVALGGPGRTVKIFLTADRQQVATLRKHTDWILALAFSPDGLLLASSDRFGGLMVWETENGKEFFNLRGHVGPIAALVWAEDGERLLCAGQDGTLRWWNLHRGGQLAQWPAHTAGVLALGLVPHSPLLSGGRDKRFCVWGEAGKKLWDLPLADEIVKIAATPDGKLAVVADAGGQTVVVSLTDRKVLGTLEIPVDASLARKSPTISRPASLVTRQTASGRTTENLNPAAENSPHDELAETRQALVAAEAAVKSVEESLTRARATAEQLKKTLARQEAAARAKNQAGRSSR